VGFRFALVRLISKGNYPWTGGVSFKDTPVGVLSHILLNLLVNRTRVDELLKVLG